MNFVNGTLNVFGILISIVLSIVLVVLLILTPFVFTAQMAMNPATIQAIAVEAIEEMEIEQLEDVDEDLAYELLQSKAMKDLLEVYMDDLYAQMADERSGMNWKDLRRIAKDNMDELLPLFRDIAKDAGAKNLPRKDSELEEYFLDWLEDHGDDLLEELPTAEDMGLEPVDEVTFESTMELFGDIIKGDIDEDDMPEVTTHMLLLFKDFWGLILMGILVAVLCILIILCRWGHGFSRLAWLGADFIIGSAISLGLGVFAKVAIFKLADGWSDVSAALGVMQPVINWLLIGGAAILVLGIIFAVIAANGDGVVAKIRWKMRKAKAA